MPNYNWDAIGRGMAMDAPLWKSKKCNAHGQYNDIVAIMLPIGEHHKASITHGCLLPMTNSADKIVAENGLTVGSMTPDPDPSEMLERELFKAKAEYDATYGGPRRSWLSRFFDWIGL